MLNMKLFIISLFLCTQFIFISAFDFDHENDTAEIHITVYRNTLHKLNCRLVNDVWLLKDKPFNVYLYSYDAIIYRPSCKINSIVLSKFEEVNGYLVSKNYYKPEFYDGAAGSCTFYKNNCSSIDGDRCIYKLKNSGRIDNGKSCTFQISYAYDYDSNPGGFISVNKREIEINHGHHNFYDRSQNLFECTKYSDGYIKLKYKPKDGPATSTEYQSVKLSGPVLSWYMKLKHKDDGGVLECYLASKTMAHVSILRLTLQLIPYDKAEFSFQVNDLVLSSELTPGLENTTFHYDYVAHLEEPLSITAEYGWVKNPGRKPPCQCFNTAKPTEFKYNENNGSLTLNTIFSKDSNKLFYQCTVNQNDATYNYALKLTEQQNSTVKSMSFANILSNLTRFNDKYMKLIEYVYEYDENSTLYCAFGWTISNIGQIKCIEKSRFDMKPKQCTFHFINNFNRTTVQCLSKASQLHDKKQVIWVHLIRTIVTKPTQVLNSTEKVHTSTISSRKENPPYRQDSPNYVEHSTLQSFADKPPRATPNIVQIYTPESNFFPIDGERSTLQTFTDQTSPTSTPITGDVTTPNLIIILAVVAFAIILILTIILLNLRRRRKTRNTRHIMDYRSLPEHNEGEMPIPSQWTDPSDLYAEPIPKSERNKTTENGPIYSAVNLTYANLNLPETKNTDYTNLPGGKNENPYARVLPSERDYANCSSVNNYANVNQYEEPTYLNSCKQ